MQVQTIWQVKKWETIKWVINKWKAKKWQPKRWQVKKYSVKLEIERDIDLETKILGDKEIEQLLCDIENELKNSNKKGVNNGDEGSRIGNIGANSKTKRSRKKTSGTNTKIGSN